MNCSGNIVDENKVHECKVNHDIIHPVYCTVTDEVGNNISMKNDGHIGGGGSIYVKKEPSHSRKLRQKISTLLYSDWHC